MCTVGPNFRKTQISEWDLTPQKGLTRESFENFFQKIHKKRRKNRLIFKAKAFLAKKRPKKDQFCQKRQKAILDQTMRPFSTFGQKHQTVSPKMAFLAKFYQKFDKNKKVGVETGVDPNFPKKADPRSKRSILPQRAPKIDPFDQKNQKEAK